MFSNFVYIVFLSPARCLVVFGGTFLFAICYLSMTENSALGYGPTFKPGDFLPWRSTSTVCPKSRWRTPEHLFSSGYTIPHKPVGGSTRHKTTETFDLKLLGLALLRVFRGNLIPPCLLAMLGTVFKQRKTAPVGCSGEFFTTFCQGLRDRRKLRVLLKQ